MDDLKLECEKIVAEHFLQSDLKDIIIDLKDNDETWNPKQQDYDHLTTDEIVEHIAENYILVDFIEYAEKRCALQNIDFDDLLEMVYDKHKAKLVVIKNKMVQEFKNTEEENEMDIDVNTEPQKLWETLCKTYTNGKNNYETADACRFMMNHIDLQVEGGKLSSDAASKFRVACLNSYCDIVDDVTEGGLNNYFEQIQSIQNTVKPQCEKWESSLDELSEKNLLMYIPTSSIETTKNESVYHPLLQLKKEDVEDEIIKKEAQELVCERMSTALENCPSALLKFFETENTKFFPDDNIHKDSTLEVRHSSPVEGLALKQQTLVNPKPDTFVFSRISPNVEDKEIGEKQKKIAVKRKQENVDFINADEHNVDEQPVKPAISFKTAKDILGIQKNDKTSNRKCLRARRGLNSKFITPVFQQDSDKNEKPRLDEKIEDIHDERLKGIDPKMVELMLNEIMDHDSPVTWDNIAGLEFAKTTLKEIVVWPLLRPDLFTGLRAPPKGILLFGPPGTGKTLIGKCVASQSNSTFFSISASSLGSKWYGEGEKLVRALFTVARCYQPAVIFIDEIDSLLTQRSDNDHESSRRVKTEFLVQLDGVKTVGEERLLIIGATNRPQELDEAARRRLVKRLYIPLPEPYARIQIVNTLLATHKHELSEANLNVLQEKTEGYSGADMANLCKEAAIGPIRSIGMESIASASNDDVRPIQMNDFIKALNQVRASVSDADLNLYEDWNKKYGSFSET